MEQTYNRKAALDPLAKALQGEFSGKGLRIDGLRIIATHECKEVLTETVEESLRGEIQGRYIGAGQTKMQAQLRTRQDMMFLKRWASNESVTRTVTNAEGKQVQVARRFRDDQAQFNDVLRAIAKPATKSGSGEKNKVSRRKLADTSDAFQTFIVACMQAKLTGATIWVWAGANVEKAVQGINAAAQADMLKQAQANTAALVEAKEQEAKQEAGEQAPAGIKSQADAVAEG